MSRYNYDTSFNNLLINYLNPERETFSEFIFRDNNGLYKYDKFKKVYINENITNELFSDTCNKLQLNEKNIIICQKFLLNVILNFNSSAFNEIYTKTITDMLKNSTNFFEIAKDNLKLVEPQIIINILKNFNFQVNKIYNNKYNLELNTVENKVDWLSRIDTKKSQKSKQFRFLINYLQTLVDYINANPTLLNSEFNEFDSKFYFIKNLEEELKINYNKNAIYNDIINANLDSYTKYDTILNNHANKIKLGLQAVDKLYYQLLVTYQNIYKNIQDKIEIDKTLFVKNIRIIKAAEENINKNIEILLNYIKMNPKNNETFDLVTNKKEQISFNEMQEQINTFVTLKNILRNAQEDLLLNYPKKNFFKYN